MLLRWLVNSWMQQQAQPQMRAAVEDLLKSQLRRPETGQKQRATGEESPVNADATPQTPPQPREIAFVFALNIEAGGLVDLLQEHAQSRGAHGVEHYGLIDGRAVVVAETGVGRESAARATEDLIRVYHPAWVVSTGFAGALRDGIKRGHLLMADTIVDTTGQQLSVGLKLDPGAGQASPGVHVGRLVTVDRLIRSIDERRALAEQVQAVACDMESFAVAETCRRLQTRFLSVRIISDAMEDVLPKEVENLLDQSSLAGKLGAVAGAILNRPSSIKDMWRLREEALKASDRLAKFLTGVIPQLR